MTGTPSEDESPCMDALPRVLIALLAAAASGVNIDAVAVTLELETTSAMSPSVTPPPTMAARLTLKAC